MLKNHKPFWNSAHQWKGKKEKETELAFCMTTIFLAYRNSVIFHLKAICLNCALLNINYLSLQSPDSCLQVYL